MAEQGFTLTSPAFVPDGIIPAGSTCDGKNASPELHWIHPPEDTRSFALILDDPDAPSGTFTHWVLFNIPANAHSIPANASNVGVAGRNDFQHAGYGGPCPPPNHDYHRYFFKLFSLDVASLELEEGVPRDKVEQSMAGHVLGETQLMGRYKRTAR